MKRRLTSLVTSACLLAMGLMSLAATASDEEVRIDGRLQGYSKTMVLDGGSLSLLWLALVGLSIVALSVLFKNAKRTHLD